MGAQANQKVPTYINRIAHLSNTYQQRPAMQSVQITQQPCSIDAWGSHWFCNAEEKRGGSRRPQQQQMTGKNHACFQAADVEGPVVFSGLPVDDVLNVGWQSELFIKAIGNGMMRTVFTC